MDAKREAPKLNPGLIEANRQLARINHALVDNLWEFPHTEGFRWEQWSIDLSWRKPLTFETVVRPLHLAQVKEHSGTRGYWCDACDGWVKGVPEGTGPVQQSSEEEKKYEYAYSCKVCHADLGSLRTDYQAIGTAPLRPL